ncbi:MAG: Pyruvate synthase subunit PorA [bacterium ADurb.Bin478]|nr:MAG: Pyruvate synthase subunit PorA [bacterium ADurb.Bin478]
MVTTGTASGTARVAVDQLRDQGEKVGLLRIRLFRPFPHRAIRRALEKIEKAAVLDRNCSFGSGGIFANELSAALHGQCRTAVYSYISGLGGRDITVDLIKELYSRTRDAGRPDSESVWLGLNEE